MNTTTRLGRTRAIVCTLLMAALLASTLASCQGSPEPTPTPPPAATATPLPPTATVEPSPTPLPPTATVEPSPTPLALPGQPVIDPSGQVTVEAGKKIAVQAAAQGATRFEWKLQGDGELSATTEPAIIYTAPPEGDTIAILTVTAYNDQGASPATVLKVTVPPVAAESTVPLSSLAIPAGWMSGGSDPGSYMKMEASAQGCHTGSDCIRVTYQVGGGWGGVIWWPPACGESGTAEAWQQVNAGTCGINIPWAGNLGSVDRLTFWTKGEKGGEVIEFKIGSVDMPPSPGRSLGKITLTSDWVQQTIDLSGMDLKNAIGLFMWIAADMDNPQGAVFYLDDIQFEGKK